MNTRTILIYYAAIGLAMLTFGGAWTAAYGQTPIGGGFEMGLLPGYVHEPLQGIDSIVGKIAKKDGLAIQYDMGRISKGGLRLGGDYVNQAQQNQPIKDRLWLKEQTAAGRKVSVAYWKDGLLIISTASETEGVNFSTMAKTSGDVADALLMVLTLAPKKAK